MGGELMAKKVVIFDDENKIAEKYRKRLEENIGQNTSLEISVFDEMQFLDSMKQIESRRKAFRSNSINEVHCPLDKTDILIIDYDLLSLNDNGGSSTGETVCYMARCFSEVKVIVGLNQYGENTFDLTLKGHLESFADVNVGSQQIDNSALWGGESAFHPCYWPNLIQRCEAFNSRMKQVEKCLDQPILETLGISDEVVNIMPKTSLGFITGALDIEPADVTFREFSLSSGEGLKGKDKSPGPETAFDHMVARIAAARISKWLERWVLPGQDILVDAPHLVSRYPSLLLGDHADIKRWDRTAAMGPYDSLGLDHGKIEDYRFKQDVWLPRPAWFWPKLIDCQRILEVKEPWEREATNLVFCEDSSSFFPEEDCEEFLAEFESPYVQRFVKKIPDVDYRPLVRMSMRKEVAADSDDS
jgi:hypothetical protein